MARPTKEEAEAKKAEAAKNAPIESAGVKTGTLPGDSTEHVDLNTEKQSEEQPGAEGEKLNPEDQLTLDAIKTLNEDAALNGENGSAELSDEDKATLENIKNSALPEGNLQNDLSNPNEIQGNEAPNENKSTEVPENEQIGGQNTVEYVTAEHLKEYPFLTEAGIKKPEETPNQDQNPEKYIYHSDFLTADLIDLEGLEVTGNWDEVTYTPHLELKPQND